MSTKTAGQLHGRGSLLYRETKSGSVALGYIVTFDGQSFTPDGVTEPLTEDEVTAHNEALSQLERERILTTQPERLAVYINGRAPFDRYDGRPVGRAVTLFDGSQIGKVLSHGETHRTFGDCRRVWARVQIGSGVYGGYRTDTRSLVFLRRLVR